MNNKPRRAVIVSYYVAICTSIIVTYGCGGSKVRQAQLQSATSLVQHLTSGQFAEAEVDFTPPMAKSLPAAKLQGVWAQLTSQLGTFQKVMSSEIRREMGFDIAYVHCLFEKGPIDVKVSFLDGKIVGLYFQPAK